MAICKDCGAYYDGAPETCPVCGARFASEEPERVEVVEEYDKQDIESNKWISVLSYLGLLVLIPYFAKKNSKFAQFHARQGITFLVFEIAAAIVFTLIYVLGSVFIGIAAGTHKALWAIPAVLLYLVAGAVMLAVGVFAVIGIVNALSGKAKELPLIGKIDILNKVFKK